MRTTRLPLWGSIAGIVTGLVAAVLLVTGGVLRVPPSRDGRDASEDFLRAWERSRRGTFVVQSEFRRTLEDGRTLFSASEIVQRPPDRLVRQFGGLSGSLNGRQVLCSTEATGQYRCFESSVPSPPYDDTIRLELDNFRSLFRGTTPALYRVGSTEVGCFELFQQIVYPSPDYGGYAKLCFDDATGALRYLERHLERAVEVIEAVTIVPQVNAGDLGTEQDPAYDLRMDLGPVAPPPPSTATPGSTPGTIPPPASDDLATLSNRELIARGEAAIEARSDTIAFVVEVIERLRDGRLSINDAVWIDDDGRTSVFGVEIVAQLLSLGFVPAG